MKPEQIPSDVTAKQGANYILDLSYDYNSIAGNYQNILTKNLRISKKNNLTYLYTSDYRNCIHLYRKYYGDRIPHVTNEDYQNFRDLCEYAIENDGLICRQVANEEGELLATILLLKDEKRLYNLMNITPPAGRKMCANHFLIDAIIDEFSESNLLLDFEGSDLPGVEAFYKSFGATNQPYYKLKYNNLPWPINILKEKRRSTASLQYKDQ